MKKWVLILTILPVFGLCFCDGPDEIYKPLPVDFNPAQVNGLVKQAMTFEGRKGFFDETRIVTATGPTVEVCTDTELADKWAWMMVQPIIPMKGAAGLDMTGGDDWSELTVDEAQSKDMLCQALYVSSSYAIWGDNIEVVAFFDSTTRKIFDILLLPGYEGTIDAPPYTFKVNQSIDKDGVPLNRTDGSVRDPRTDDNMRDINRALLRAFRPNVPGGPDSVDCVETGSCFVVTSGTLPLVVFIDVGLYIPLEPTNLRIYDIEVSLKRPFNFNMSRVEFDGTTPTMRGYGSCTITYGTKWSHILSECVGDDPIAMAEFQPADSYEHLWSDLGGVSFWLKRSLATDEIMRLGDEPEADDEVIAFAWDESYEGPIAMPLSPVLQIFKDKLIERVRAEAGLEVTEPTGVETLRMPGDPDLPSDVSARYPNRLLPRTVKVAFCTDDGPDPGTQYDSCIEDVNGSVVLLLMKTLESNVATALGGRVTPILRERIFYAELFLESYFEHLNGGLLVPSQAKYSPGSRAEQIYGTLMMSEGGVNYTIDGSYAGKDDRMGPMYFYKGTNRPESVLFRDAELPMPGDTSPTGVFLFDRLIASPRLGLGSTNISVETIVTDIRRAILNFPMSETEVKQTLVPFIPGSTTEGYWTPVEGAHNEFHESDYMSLYGHTLGAGFYMVPTEGDPGKKEVVGVVSGSFFGPISFCGQSISLGDRIEDIRGAIVDANYPCTLITTWSEGEIYISSLASIEDQKKIYFDNDRFDMVFAWQ